MSGLTRQNLENRNMTIKAQLGVLAYRRREHQIEIEKIDEQVAAMEAQGVVIEATLKDLNFDEARENERKLKEQADAKEERSQRAKTAAKTRKRGEKK